MKIKLMIEKEYDVTTLLVEADVRHPENATVNGVEDTEGVLLPCMRGNLWCPEIEIETGRIVNWEQGKSASIHFKVCDEGTYSLLSETREVIQSMEGYVPSCLCPTDNGYGDYIIMDISIDGFIYKWKFKPSDFSEL